MFTQNIKEEIMVEVDNIDLSILWLLYKEFCVEASQTQDMKTNNVSDFLGWLEKYQRRLHENK